VKIALIVLFAIATPAAAEINTADSIEWQTIEADVIVRGFVTGVKTLRGESTVTVQIAESLKGGLKQSVLFVTNLDAKPWQKDKPELLLFLVKVDDGRYVPAPANGSSESLFVLGKHRAYTAAFDVLDKPAEVLAAVRGATRSTATAKHRVDLPDSPAAKALYAGSAVWLFVPVDAVLEKHALAWTADKSPSLREQGVLALANFRSDTNIAVMKKLLADPATSVTSPYDSVKPKRRFYIRAAAHEVLVKWGVSHKTPVLEMPMK
jgi:hypothetical protein